jgi:hypothetical protein
LITLGRVVHPRLQGTHEEFVGEQTAGDGMTL